MFLNRLSPRTLFSLTQSSLPSFIAKYSTSSPSHLTDPYSHSHADSRNVRVSVWWDLDSCPVPLGVSAYRVSEYIKTALQANRIRGPIEIAAFTNMLHLRTDPWVLSSTGVGFNDVTQGGTVGNVRACESLNQTLTAWASRNAPPAHVFVITADESSAVIMQKLSINYNILLATKESAPAVLSTAANIIWSWDALVNGCKVPSIFSQESFWRDVKTFINSDIGYFILSESRTRENMADYLKKGGPADVRSLTFGEALILVDLLISEKKWVEDTPRQINPFRLNSNYGN